MLYLDQGLNFWKMQVVKMSNFEDFYAMCSYS